MVNAQQIDEIGVALGLFDNAFASVNQHDGELRSRGARHHVAGVLDMAGRVGDDEFALGRGEVAIGDINGDALFALGFEAVGEKREVDVIIAALARRVLDGFELVFKNVFGIVEQAANQRRFAVINGAASGESE